MGFVPWLFKPIKILERLETVTMIKRLARGHGKDLHTKPERALLTWDNLSRVRDHLDKDLECHFDSISDAFGS